MRETGKYLIEHVWEAIAGCPRVSRTIIATDSDDVERAARSFGADVVMTSAAHPSGTDRVAEVARGLDDEIVINVQGDEPFVTHGDISRLIDLFADEPAEFGRARSDPAARSGRSAPVAMTTLVVPRSDPEGFADPNIVKCVFSPALDALYFSRAPIPYDRRDAGAPPPSSIAWWQHLGIYGYRRDFLLAFSALEPTPLERRERLEQLRALENGHRVRVGEVSGRRIGIDTAEDYHRFVRLMAEEGARGSRRGGLESPCRSTDTERAAPDGR